MATISVDVYVDDVLDQIDNDDLIEELENRGFFVSEEEQDVSEFDKEDWSVILSMFDKIEETWQTRRVRDKVLKVCYG